VPAGASRLPSGELNVTQSASYRLIDGRAIAESIHREVEAEARALRERGSVPHLVAVQVGENPATNVYIQKQKDRFSRLGIQYTHRELDRSTSQEALISHLEALNENPTVTGIIVTLPLPEGISAPRVQEAIHAEKDVEGVNPSNMGRLIYNRRGVGPCTALAVMTAIDSTGVEIEGKHVVMVGHSDIVGKPVGLCLLQEMATITTCHAATRVLGEHTSRADILVVAVGKAGIITGDMVRAGVIVIDVGINHIPGPPPRTAGDVDFATVAPRSSWITPVPGGIGPITVAMLARNTMRCARAVFAGEAP
jgi:methylenetetrahydrofolate dehydrogenase (NADP+)/methenyltetrahydrofolate cyclohydrolase